MRLLLAVLPLGGFRGAQSFIPAAENIAVLPSVLFQGAEISYKQTSICETTEGVNAYSGYVTLPKYLLADATGWADGQSAHIFFWFFESRNDPSTSPTSIYLGGGPGSTSLDGLSGFPCSINPDSNSTTVNEFSWNNNVNMLYIDQPIGTGFTYVALQDGVLDVLTQQFQPVLDVQDLPELNQTTLPATLDVTGYLTAANTTMSAARTAWSFAQVWFNEFPEWRTDSPEISIWSASYGGLYGPAFFSHFYDQNERIRNDEIEPLFANATILDLSTLGLTDACVDSRSMALGFPEFAHNNTYGLEIFSEAEYESIREQIVAPEVGCHALIDQCRAVEEQGDPMGFGNNATVNEACSAASIACIMSIQAEYSLVTDRSPLDLAHTNLTLTPPPYHAAFYNQRWVQQDLGVPLNFTVNSWLLPALFLQVTGDPVILGLENIENVLERGTKVALVYGDRDYRCNWYGGEDASLVLESPSSEGFRLAGYESIITEAANDVGYVREYGNLSFSRILQAGHGVTAYQPEAMFDIFERVMFDRDVATGDVDLGQNRDYSTEGPDSVAGVRNDLPEPVPNVCYVLQPSISCTLTQLAALVNGSAVIENWVMVDPPGEYPAASVLSLSDRGRGGNIADAEDNAQSNAGKVHVVGGALIGTLVAILMTL